MTNEERYYAAMFPDRFSILGRRLHDYCLGHKILLGYLAVDKGIGLSTTDLAMGLMICSRSWEEGFKLVHSRSFSKRLRFLAWQLRVSVPAQWVLEAKTHFVVYVDKGGELPPYTKPKMDEGGRCAGAPIVQQMQMVLREVWKYPFTRIMNMPLAHAHWDYFAARERGGQVLITADEEIDYCDAIDREMEKIAAEGTGIAEGTPGDGASSFAKASADIARPTEEGVS